MNHDAIQARILGTLRQTGHPMSPAELAYQCLPANVSDTARDAALSALKAEGRVGLDGGVVALKSRKEARV